jgi:nitrite reductase/ring-hydroxylating ferredoxin subunit/uncharacterized membrane protein
MQSTAHFKGHPVHAMLVPFPFAYLVGSAALDAWARATGRRELFRTATHLNTLGLTTALAAAVPGLVDYTFTVPPRSSAKKRATSHMLSNLTALGLFALARSGRRANGAPPRWWAMAAEICGAGFLSAGAFMGGTLVVRNQIGIDHRYASAGKWQVEVLPESAGALDVGGVDDLKVDQMKLLRIGSHRIVLARTERGYAAFDDRCTHRGGPLSDGTLACDTVQCPWHGSQFDVHSGRVKHGPAEEAIATYAVEERNGRVWLMPPVSETYSRSAVRRAL